MACHSRLPAQCKLAFLQRERDLVCLYEVVAYTAVGCLLEFKMNVSSAVVLRQIPVTMQPGLQVELFPTRVVDPVTKVLIIVSS